NEVDGVTHVGELHYLWRNGILGDGTNSVCGCAAPVPDCPLWSKVLGLAGGPDPLATARLWAVAQDRTVRARHTVRRLGANRSPAARELASRMAQLYSAIAEFSGARTIVDSSKYPAEAALLAASGEVDLRILHVV